MPAFQDYTDLQISVSEYTGRTDVANVFDRLTQMAEAKLNRLLRVAGMEAETQLTTDVNGDATLPTDYVEMREVKDARGCILKSQSLPALTRAYGNRGGTPSNYAIVGTTFTVRPIAEGTFDITYYQEIPSLTSNATNWLLSSAPDVYLYALAAEVAAQGQNPEGIAAAEALLNPAVRQLQINDGRARFGNASLRMRYPRP